ncbi:MAG: choice-of-anchor Q domain-containing protein, partial [Planctomycetota bacterium]
LVGGELTISSSLTINGSVNGLQIDGRSSHRVFRVDDGVSSQANVTIRDLSIRNGLADGADGGGVLNRENLTLERVSVFSNETSRSGTGGRGSGIANLGGTLTVRDSQITRNQSRGSAGVDGGGIYSTGPLTVTGSVIADNSVDNSNSTRGGGIYTSGGAVIRHSTIAGNSLMASGGSVEAQGGGIFATGGLILDHVVVADNTAAGDPSRDNIPDVAGAVTSYYSLIEDITGATITDNGGTITGIDPQLTNNRTPAEQSALVNAGDPAAFPGQGNVPLTDFEGNPRLQRSRIDIGAMEVQFPPTLLSFTRQTPSDEITTADTLVFTAIFDEAVTNLDGSDFDVTGTTATVTGVTAVNPTEFTLTVSGGDLATVSAVVGLNLNSNQNITDLGGDPLGNTEPAVDETYSLDNAGPAITDIRPDNRPLNPVSWPGHITVKATDPNGVASVGIGIRNLGAARFWDGTAFASRTAVYFPATRIPNTDDWRIPFDESNLSTQNHRFWIQATDNLGNQINDARGPIFFYDQTITVDTLTDVSNGDFSVGDLSLREALEQIATFSGGPYTIGFAEGLSGQTLNLTSGPLTIAGDVTIDGDLNNDGKPDITINAGNGTDGLPRTYDGNRIFTIDDGDSSKSSSVTIDGLTLMGGDSGTFGGGSAGASGGAIFNSENLTVKNSVLKVNATRANGGAIFSSPSAAVTVIDSALTGNFANNAGGAIYVDSFGVGEIRNSLIAQNSSTNVGGGLLNLGNVGIVNSTFSANTTTSSGGAVSNGGHLNVGHSTFAQNVAASGGTDIGGLGLTDSANLSHSIFTGTVDGQTTVTGDYNLFAGTVTIAGSNNLMNTDPKLGPLQDNGGLTQTHAPTVDSPAIGGGDFLLMSGVSIVPVNDQRGPGFDRVVDVIDIGAFEDIAPVLHSFTRQTPMSELTNADSLVFRATFSEDVQNVGARAFSVDGSVNTRVSGVAPIDARTYD